jgi:hypothetical protein
LQAFAAVSQQEPVAWRYSQRSEDDA